MDKRKLLIAESAEDFRDALAQTLQGAYHISITSDGQQALQLVRSFMPDILVLDLMLPGLDGITLLQQAVDSGIQPMVLATTRYPSEYTLASLERLGVEYVMVKPCDLHAVTLRIKDLSQQIKVPAFSQPEPRALISNTLLRLGISTKLRGYSYLREAIILMSRDPNQSITKELYPAVAALCDGTAIQIERSIRSAITTAWGRKDPHIWQLYFAADETGTISRPTNAAFISRLADILILGVEHPGLE